MKPEKPNHRKNAKLINLCRFYLTSSFTKGISKKAFTKMAFPILEPIISTFVESRLLLVDVDHRTELRR